MWVVMLATLALVFFLSFRISKTAASAPRRGCSGSMPRCSASSLSSIFLAYTGVEDHPGVLHHGGTFGAMSL